MWGGILMKPKLQILIVFIVALTMGMMIAHKQAQHWMGSKSEKVEMGYECTK